MGEADVNEEQGTEGLRLITIGCVNFVKAIGFAVRVENPVRYMFLFSLV